MAPATKAGLAAWLALTAAAVPEAFGGKRFHFQAEDVPMEYTRALAALAPKFGIRLVWVLRGRERRERMAEPRQRVSCA